MTESRRLVGEVREKAQEAKRRLPVRKHYTCANMLEIITFHTRPAPAHYSFRAGAPLSNNYLVVPGLIIETVNYFHRH